jgi:predicted acetyltransferase
MEIIKSDQSNRAVIENMMQLYLHDLSSFTSDVPNENGLFSLGKYFGLYWEEKERYPYILFIDNQAAGFALVREIERSSYSIAEFFVSKPYRKQGIATKFAHDVFDQHLGNWCVAQLEPHTGAQDFWRKAISSYTNNQFSEKWSDSQPKGPMQTFVSSAQQSAKTDT